MPEGELIGARADSTSLHQPALFNCSTSCCAQVSSGSRNSSVVVGQLGAVRGGLDRLVERAELIDQTQALGVGSRPYAPLGDRVDVGAGLLAPAGDALEELVVAAVDLRLQQCACLGAQRPVEAQLPRERRGPHAVDADADLAERRSTVGMIAKMPIEPVRVAGLAQISSAGAEM